jgi:hypothetical protein
VPLLGELGRQHAPGLDHPQPLDLQVGRPHRGLESPDGLGDGGQLLGEPLQRGPARVEPVDDRVEQCQVRVEVGHDGRRARVAAQPFCSFRQLRPQREQARGVRPQRTPEL